MPFVTMYLRGRADGITLKGGVALDRFLSPSLMPCAAQSRARLVAAKQKAQRTASRPAAQQFLQPDWVSHLGAAFGDGGLALMVPRLGRRVRTDNAKARALLRFDGDGAFRTPAGGGLDMCLSLIAVGAVPDKTRGGLGPGSPAAQLWLAPEPTESDLRGVRPTETW